MSGLLWLMALYATGLPGSGSEPRTVARDTTLVDTVQAGDVLIRALPTWLEGDSVVSYRPQRVPATGWAKDRSFFWRTPEDGEGNYRFRFSAVLTTGEVRTVEVRVFLASVDN